LLPVGGMPKVLCRSLSLPETSIRSAAVNAPEADMKSATASAGYANAVHVATPDERAVALRVGNSQQVIDMVLRREADLGFVEGPRAPEGLRSRVVGEDEMVVVVAPDHAWARRRKPLALAKLAATPLILREPGSGTREAAWEVLQRAGEPAPPAAELGSTTAIKAAAAAREAPAVLSRLAVREELASRRLVAVPVEDAGQLRRRFRAIWLHDTPPAGSAAALLAIALRRA
jgi:DNA-binding transcriptional LysR family regulator